MEVEIRGSEILTEADFHRLIADALNLSEHYGRNLDALTDVLSTDVERPLTLTWRNSQVSRINLGEAFDTIVGVLKRIEAQDLQWGLAETFCLKLA